MAAAGLDSVRLVAEHARGDSYRTIASRHDISRETARQIVLRDGRRFIDSMELGLYIAWKLEQQGREDEAEWPALVVPFQDQQDWQLALSLLQFTVAQLREDRGLDINVRNQRTPDGHVFQLTIEELPGAAS